MTGRQNGTGCSKSLPPPEEVIRLASALVNQEIAVHSNPNPEQATRGHLDPGRGDGSESDGRSDSAAEKHWASLVPPEWRTQLISQFIQVSRPFGVSDNPPGHAPLTFQMLTVPGGEESDLAKDLKRESDGVTIRAFDDDKAHEAVALTECEFVLWSTCQNLCGANSGELSSLQSGPMIVATETDAAILPYFDRKRGMTRPDAPALALDLALERSSGLARKQTDFGMRITRSPASRKDSRRLWKRSPTIGSLPTARNRYRKAARLWAGIICG